jgi:hypothetical protein
MQRDTIEFGSTVQNMSNQNNCLKLEDLMSDKQLEGRTVALRVLRPPAEKAVKISVGY